MESKLLYDFYICSLIERTDIVNVVQKKLQDQINEIDYYDVIYSDNLDNKAFLNKLGLICHNTLLDGELKKKYGAVITFFYKKQANVNIEESLYNFFINKDKELLDIDLDFWNLISTDWELKKDGFSGISGSSKTILNYLQDKSDLRNLPDNEILDVISTV
jgi:hypothetical protein